jgi:hypothetical protein
MSKREKKKEERMGASQDVKTGLPTGNARGRELFWTLGEAPRENIFEFSCILPKKQRMFVIPSGTFPQKNKSINYAQ